jgi:hypothetical protein
MSQKNYFKGENGLSRQKAARNERGQILPFVAILMTFFLCMCGFVIDIGRVYVSYQQLLASTDAAALAGGEALGEANSTVAEVTAAVKKYSSASGGVNPSGMMTKLVVKPYVGCITGLSPNIPCYGAGSYNAVQVVQTASVPMTFANFFGAHPVALSATATASMSGAAATPYNVAIIVDTTSSMSDPDTGSTCTTTRLACALGGVATLMGELAPCPNSGSCSISNNVSTSAVDRVALFTFPGMTTATAANDTTCPTSNPNTESVYTFPSKTVSATASSNTTLTTTTTTTTTKNGKKTTTTTTTDIPMTYQITNGLGDAHGFLSDYRTSDTATTLNASSPLSIAIGSGKSGCKGVADPGGAGTFYAAVIYAATDALLAEQAANPTAQNVIIIISDGDASSTQAQMAGGSGATGTNTGGAGNATSNGTYPSWKNECHQAVTAAAAAAALGIRVYSVAYGAESSGCSTDSPAISPCQTMKGIASNPGYFFSDYASSGGGTDTSCAGSGASTTSINQIFQYIYYSLGHGRLLSNAAPPGGSVSWTAE